MQNQRYNAVVERVTRHVVTDLPTARALARAHLVYLAMNKPKAAGEFDALTIERLPFAVDIGGITNIYTDDVQHDRPDAVLVYRDDCCCYCAEAWTIILLVLFWIGGLGFSFALITVTHLSFFATLGTVASWMAIMASMTVVTWRGCRVSCWPIWPEGGIDPYNPAPVAGQVAPGADQC